jgi:dihydroneopterin aldolase
MSPRARDRGKARAGRAPARRPAPGRGDASRAAGSYGPPAAPEDVLRLCGIQAYGHLGVTQKERDLGQRVEADIELGYPAARDRRPDVLDAVIDYEDVHRVVHSQIEMSRCRLLETLAEELALTLLTEFQVPRVRIRIRKLHVPVSGFQAYPEVEIERRQP